MYSYRARNLWPEPENVGAIKERFHNYDEIIAWKNAPCSGLKNAWRFHIYLGKTLKIRAGR